MCQGCNNKKWIHTTVVDAITQKTVPLFNPRIHNWLEHYSWSEDFLQMIGISAIGRATIDFLKLNRKGVVNLRLATLALEKHPPDL